MFRAAAAAALRNRQRQEEKRERAKRAQENKRLGRPTPVVGYTAEELERIRRGSLEGSEHEYETIRDSAPFSLETDFRIKISEVLRRKEKSVYYKDDEERFPQENTLKLRKEGKYKISVEVPEGIHVEYVKLGGILWDEFNLEKNSDDTMGHTFSWNTDKMDLTGNHYRAVFPCVVKLEDQEEIGFDLLLKFYKKDMANYAKGFALSHLSLDCSESVDKQRNQSTYKLVYHQQVRL